jgi:hypothetical protein
VNFDCNGELDHARLMIDNARVSQVAHGQGTSGERLVWTAQMFIENPVNECDGSADGAIRPATTEKHRRSRTGPPTMADGIEYTRHRYDLFWQLDYQVSAYGPDDVTAEMAEKLLAALKAISSGRRADKPGDPTPPSATTIDLTARAQRRIDTPTWEDTWTRFKQDIRNERIRLGRELGIEPEPTLP